MGWLSSHRFFRHLSGTYWIRDSAAQFYTDLSQTYLYVKFRILNENGDDLADESKVYPVNNLFHSMFCGIDLYLNNKLVTTNSDTYPYRAYFENLFSYGSGVIENQLKVAEFWYEDVPGVFEDMGYRTHNHDVPLARRKSVELQGRSVDHIWISLCKKNICQME